MSKELIITMTASNRAGILAAVTRAMAELGGDLREASQTVVRGFFTMIFAAEFPDDLESEVVCDHLRDACSSFGIDFTVKDSALERPSDFGQGEVLQRQLRLGGRNRRGALRELSTVLALFQVDITNMYAVRTEQGGGFEMVMKLAIPATTRLDEMLGQLQDKGRDFEVTVQLEELRS